MRRIVGLLLALVAVGCTTQRTITINTRPTDATIKINGVDRGRAPITETFLFGQANQVHRVVASRGGYKDATWNVTSNYTQKSHLIELLPLTRKVTINISPEPAIIKIDGKEVSPQPLTSYTVPEMEFTQDALGNWTTYEITAERKGFQTARKVISWPDLDPDYTLELLPVEKDLNVTSDPAGAEIFLDEQSLGVAPVHTKATQFRVDTELNQLIPRTLRAVKPGYDPVFQPIAWDGGRNDYHLKLEPRKKVIHITTDPPGATVSIGGIDAFNAAHHQSNQRGLIDIELTFPPVNEKGDLPEFTIQATKQEGDRQWYPATVTVGWEDGKVDYAVKLKEILTVRVPLISIKMRRGSDNWSIGADRLDTIAMKEVAEKENPTLQRIYTAQAGEFIDTLAVSPDGQRLAFSVIASDAMPLRAQIRSISSSGKGGEMQHTDGSALELMPSFTPDGLQIVFSSDRMSRSMSVCSMRVNGTGGITEITRGNDSYDLWPAVDSDPRQRLFYTRYMEKRDEPRLYMQQISGGSRTDLTNRPGTQPKPSPKADAIVFASGEEGHRDIFRLPELGTPENLTNTRDADELEPVYSYDGTKVIFVSNRAVDPETGANRDIWLLDLSSPDQPVQVTSNGSWDDCPVWDPSGNAVYFRSNRGGQWGIWKITLK